MPQMLNVLKNIFIWMLGSQLVMQDSLWSQELSLSLSNMSYQNSNLQFKLRADKVWSKPNIFPAE